MVLDYATLKTWYKEIIAICKAHNFSADGPPQKQLFSRIKAECSEAYSTIAKEGKKMMKNLVKQSLHKNMEMITWRANAPEDSSKLKTLEISTSSKSLPY
ncbi:u-box domain-containing protein 7 [Fagus crenata]